LNRELVQCARRLQSDDLVERIDGILAGLSQIPDGATLQPIMTQFRTHCRQLAALIEDHNACQDADTALAVVGPASVTHDRLAGWPDVLAAMLRIAARRPDDPRAGRIAGYAREFDAAADANQAAAPFALLRGDFGRLFTKTDDDLLKVTDKLVQEATRLDDQLGKFSP
jgi:hypothetical protein